jgi:hypothetical protein
VIIERRLGVHFGSLWTEMMPMGEGRPINIAACEGAIYALFASERLAARYLAENRMSECGCRN